LEATHLKDIQQTLADIATNKQRIYNTKGQIEQAQYAQRLASVRFTNGVGTNLELINASSNVQRALLTKLQYEFQLCLANVELAKLLGEKYW
jgi:outer membrane protein TolC